jgi:hypothetical protein
MGLVRGEDVIVSIAEYQDGVGFVYIPIGCARSVTFDISTDFIETSVTESGAFKTFIPSGKQYSGNIEGLVFLDKPKTSETRATFTFDFTGFVDDFPSDGTNVDIQVQLPDTTYELLYGNLGAPFATFSLFINSIKDGINSSGTGFTSVISGNLLIITSAPGYGASMNGQLCIYSIETGTLPNMIGSSGFAGGANGYFPSKYNLGLMYSKIISGEILGLKYYETDDDNHFLQKECEVYIESINETASFDNMVTFSATFKGTGAPTITYGED